MKTLILQRIDQTPAGTIGRFSLDGEFLCYSVELPWEGNQRNISCIPAGKYDLAWEQSPKFGRRLHVNDVYGRSHILIHAANFQRQIKGCIMPATTVGRKTEGPNVGCCAFQSRLALEKIEAAMPFNGFIWVKDCHDYGE